MVNLRFGKSWKTTMIINDIAKLAQNKGISPLIVSSGKRPSVIQRIPILIIIVNKLRVIIRKGRVIILRLGLIKEFIKPKATPIKSIVFSGPEIDTPETNSVASQIPIIPAITCKIISLITDIIVSK